MPQSHPEIPAAPSSFHRFAWHGMALILPEEWNLARHDGTRDKGALFFNDLRAARFALRWKSFSRFRKNAAESALLRTLTRLRRRFPGEAEPLAPNAFLMRRKEQTFALAADACRLYELHWPAASEHFSIILDDFLAHTPPLALAAEWYWSIYGAAGWLPARAKLRRVSLLPGQTRLDFVIDHLPAELASHSLADHLLAGHSLRQWAAAISFIRSHPKGAWEESAGALAYAVMVTRGMRRSVSHRICVTHDPAANRIHWTHRAERAKT